MYTRIPSSLGYLTPVEFGQKWQTSQLLDASKHREKGWRGEGSR